MENQCVQASCNGDDDTCEQFQRDYIPAGGASTSEATSGYDDLLKRWFIYRGVFVWCSVYSLSLKGIIGVLW